MESRKIPVMSSGRVIQLRKGFYQGGENKGSSEKISLRQQNDCGKKLEKHLEAVQQDTRQSKTGKDFSIFGKDPSRYSMTSWSC